MRDSVIAVALLLACQASAPAQERTAENGYYPPTYQGATFTGTVTAIDQATGEITLSYVAPNPKKSQTFVGVLEKGYTIKYRDGSKRLLEPSNIPIGARLTVFYMETHKKLEGKKVKVNIIFEIQSAPNIIERQLVFKVFH